MDDLYIFQGRNLNDLGEMLQFGRPLAMLLQSVYSGMSWESSHKGRIITAFVILIFALMVYLWLLSFAKKGYIPLVGAVLVAGSFTLADTAGLICIIHMPLQFPCFMSRGTGRLFHSSHEPLYSCCWQAYCITLPLISFHSFTARKGAFE